MTTPLFDRSRITSFPLAERFSKVSIERDCVNPATWSGTLAPELAARAVTVAEEIIAARRRGAAVICAFGAHSIKNGLGRLLGEMLRRRWFTHLATNGAGVIHDWEFAYLGKSSEDVRGNVALGRFGTWEETGFLLNLAIAVGAAKDLGYGAAVGEMIVSDGLTIPSPRELLSRAGAATENSDAPTLNRAAAALDLLELTRDLQLAAGRREVKHQWRDYSVAAAATLTAAPFTCHPMFGHDIIYTHRANRGAAIGRGAERDFLSFVDSVAHLEGGVYLSVGSAVMSPMIFEKALSMARNAAGGAGIRDCGIHVIDLQPATWDWSQGEPPMDNPAYYLRFMKTFNRMGCRVDYTSGDNRDFLVALYRELERRA
jgi:hypothetical protein